MQERSPNTRNNAKTSAPRICRFSHDFFIVLSFFLVSSLKVEYCSAAIHHVEVSPRSWSRPNQLAEKSTKDRADIQGGVLGVEHGAYQSEGRASKF